MKEVYVSTDIESDGPIPGHNSMLSLGSAAFTADGEMISTFEANLMTLTGAKENPETMAWWQTQPEAWEACRKDQQEPNTAMHDYYKWLTELPGKPVFVGYPAGYDCQWDCVAASTVGAPHHRARAFILAYDPNLGVQRLFPKEIRRQPEYAKYENCRTVQDILRLPNHPEPLIRRRVDGTYPRLHGLGNGNPPCIIRELMKDLPTKG